MSTEFIQANGIRFHVKVEGPKNAPLMMMLHGFPSSHHCWRHQVGHFSKSYRVVTPDLRGYNLTDKPKDGYDLANLTEDVVALMRALGHEDMVLVGHDWGGVIAWNVGLEHPEVLKKLVILNAPHPVLFQREIMGNIEQLKKSWYIFFFQLPMIPELYLSQNYYEKMVASFRSAAAKENRNQFTEEDINIYREGFGQPKAVECMLAYYRESFKGMVKSLLSGKKEEKKFIEVPTQVIWGMKDSALGPGNLDGLDEFVPGVRIDKVENSGHWVQEEKPDEVNQFMADFLGLSQPKKRTKK